jgi:hypothetical protein
MLQSILVVHVFMTRDVPLFPWALSMDPRKVLHLHGLIGLLFQQWM